MINIIPTSTFPLGQVVATSNALRTLTAREIREGLESHAKAERGDVSEASVELNNEALDHGDRVMSAFGEGEKRFWIITEADRSTTTILLPLDY